MLYTQGYPVTAYGERKDILRRTKGMYKKSDKSSGKLISGMILCSLALFLPSCANNSRTITEFDAMGNKLRTTQAEFSDTASYYESMESHSKAQAAIAKAKSEAISGMMVNMDAGMPDSTKAILMYQANQEIASMKSSEYNGQKPLSGMDVVNTLVSGDGIVGKIVDAASMTILGVEAIHALPDIVGDKTSVSNGSEYKYSDTNLSAGETGYINNSDMDQNIESFDSHKGNTDIEGEATGSHGYPKY